MLEWDDFIKDMTLGQHKDFVQLSKTAQLKAFNRWMKTGVFTSITASKTKEKVMKKELEEVVLEGTIVSDQVTRKVIEYSSNNSGGSWWLDDDDWHNLEKAGWKVEWKDGRWLGALATRATREGLSLDAAIAEWEEIVGQSANDEGCDCCGRPHYFSED